MKPLGIYITMLLSLFVLRGCSDVCAHEFETGQVERSIDVVVRGQKIQVTYSIGLADETIVDWLVREGKLDQVAEDRYRKCIAVLEIASKEEQGNAVRIRKPIESVTKESIAAKPLAFQTELMQLLREQLADSVCENLQISLDGKEVQFSDTTVANSARHHVAMEIALTAELPEPKTTELLLVDKNFLETVSVGNGQPGKTDVSDSVAETSTKTTKKFRYFGNVRLACRVKGEAIQLNSNVAPVLARAKPADVRLLTLEERTEAATIRTKISFAKPAKSEPN